MGCTSSSFEDIQAKCEFKPTKKTRPRRAAQTPPSGYALAPSSAGANSDKRPRNLRKEMESGIQKAIEKKEDERAQEEERCRQFAPRFSRGVIRRIEEDIQCGRCKVNQSTRIPHADQKRICLWHDSNTSACGCGGQPPEAARPFVEEGLLAVQCHFNAIDKTLLWQFVADEFTSQSSSNTWSISYIAKNRENARSC